MLRSSNLPNFFIKNAKLDSQRGILMSQIISAIVLAAGKGTRMNSALPKVLHPVAGMPMIAYVLSNIKILSPKHIRVVVGHGRNLVEPLVKALGATTYVQEKMMGTGDAVRCAEPASLEGSVLIMNGDHPLVQIEDLKKAHSEFLKSGADLAVLSASVKEPGSYGRIVRHQGRLKAIVEARHATSETLNINEINTGIYFIKAEHLARHIHDIECNSEKSEFYLTDLVEIFQKNDLKTVAIECNQRVAFGVNTQAELAQATKSIFTSKNRQLLEEGVILIDPANTYVEPTVKIGHGSVIYPGAYLRGMTKIGTFCVIEPNVFAINATIADSVQIRAGSYLEDANVETKAVVGPYARLRPDTNIGENARVGNFVEMKKVNFGKNSKANHLTYLGDADIGENVNIGCGTITCNYAADKKKYKTKIGNDVFVGSDSQLVAPVSIGNGAIIGSGSTITKDVPDHALAVARAKQMTKENYAKKYQTQEHEE